MRQAETVPADHMARVQYVMDGRLRILPRAAFEVECCQLINIFRITTPVSNDMH